jgi:hypothetical protein
MCPPSSQHGVIGVTLAKTQPGNDDDDEDRRDAANVVTVVLQVPSNFLYQKEAPRLVLTLVSLRLHELYRDRLFRSPNDTRFSEIRSLRTFIHAEPYTAVSAEVEFGQGYRLPYIVDLQEAQRSNHQGHGPVPPPVHVGPEPAERSATT